MVINSVFQSAHPWTPSACLVVIIQFINRRYVVENNKTITVTSDFSHRLTWTYIFMWIYAEFWYLI